MEWKIDWNRSKMAILFLMLTVLITTTISEFSCKFCEEFINKTLLFQQRN